MCVCGLNKIFAPDKYFSFIIGTSYCAVEEVIQIRICGNGIFIYNGIYI